jgi:DNA helicase-2/ATP-dependent DNA helicase PcrA
MRANEKASILSELLILRIRLGGKRLAGIWSMMAAVRFDCRMDRPRRVFCFQRNSPVFTNGAGKSAVCILCILCSSLEGVDRFTKALVNRGCNLKADGRPILGIDSEELLKMLLDADPGALMIPAHAWTPWFAVFGSQSGFDSLEECFGEMTPHIHAIETGLSSDPKMNWRLPSLDQVFLVSNSDAHSLDKLGREANVFEMKEPSFAELRRILVEKDVKKFIETIEFFPEEGKYHVDGHRLCDFSCTPQETKRLKGLCPKCGKPLDGRRVASHR